MGFCGGEENSSRQKTKTAPQSHTAGVSQGCSRCGAKALPFFGVSLVGIVMYISVTFSFKRHLFITELFRQTD